MGGPEYPAVQILLDDQDRLKPQGHCALLDNGLELNRGFKTVVLSILKDLKERKTCKKN